jgi:glycosyltransferase involved in cell wall biosynthesis
MSRLTAPTPATMVAGRRPIHAVMFTPETWGGHARYTWELMCALRAAAPPSELRLSLVTSRNLDREFREAEYTIYEVLPPLYPGPFPSSLHWAISRLLHYRLRDAMLLRFIRDLGDVDIVHYQEPPLLAYHYSRLRRLGIDPVFTVHNLLPHSNNGLFKQRLTTAGWRRCSALFVHSDGLRDQLLERMGSSGPPIVSVPHGPWRVPSRSQSTSEDRPHRKQLLLFGTLRRNKGIDLMLDALKHVPGAQLTIAGQFETSTLRDEVLARLQDKTLAVRLIDRFVSEEETAKLFAEATLAVLPYTNFHAQSGVLHLALSHGVPVVVTDVGALGEFVRKERVGIVSPPNDAMAFAEAIRRALEPVTHQDLREACVRHSASHSWKEAAQRTLRCYQDVIGSRSPRSVGAPTAAIQPRSQDENGPDRTPAVNG